MRKWHEAVEAASKAVVDLHRKGFGEQASRIVRVEANREILADITEPLRTMEIPKDRFAQIGPCQIMGVSYYEVLNLPAPGWRVITID